MRNDIVWTQRDPWVDRPQASPGRGHLCNVDAHYIVFIPKFGHTAGRLNKAGSGDLLLSLAPFCDISLEVPTPSDSHLCFISKFDLKM